MSSVLRPPAVRVEALTGEVPDELVRFVDADPFVNAVVSARLHAAGSLEPRRLGGIMLAVRDADGALAGAALAGGNLMPVGGAPDQWRALGRHLAARRRPCSSIIGRTAAVESLRGELTGAWDEPRAVRTAQPLLALESAAGLPPGDGRVRRVRREELDRYLPAAAAMFTEELGISPYRQTGVADYRRRVETLIAHGHAHAVFDEAGEVVFKADLGVVSRHTCQVQGVWVRPELRGRGLATAALVPVLRAALQLAPTVSLYVNDYNIPARRLYARLGMRPVATLSTVLY